MYRLSRKIRLYLSRSIVPLLLFSPTLYASVPVELFTASFDVKLNAHIEFLFDKNYRSNESLEIQDIVKHTEFKAFTPQYGSGYMAYWIRFKIYNRTNAPIRGYLDIQSGAASIACYQIVAETRHNGRTTIIDPNRKLNTENPVFLS